MVLCVACEQTEACNGGAGMACFVCVWEQTGGVESDGVR